MNTLTIALVLGGLNLFLAGYCLASVVYLKSSVVKVLNACTCAINIIAAVRLFIRFF